METQSNTLSKKPFPNIGSLTSTDDLRENLKHVFFDKNRFVATDGHVLIVVPFELEEGHGMPERFFVHRRYYKQLTSKKIESITKVDRFLVGLDVDRNYVGFCPFRTDLDYPNYDKILAKPENQEPMCEIGWTPYVLSKAMRVASGVSTVRMMIYTASKGVHIKPQYPDDEPFEMVIMPSLLRDF